MIKKAKLFIIILIFILFISLRFYQLEKRISFDWDQEQFSYQVKKILVNNKLTLLGPRVNNDQGFFLGPYFTYLLVPFYLLSNLHPYALIYFVAVYNFLFFFISFFIIRKIFDGKTAFFFCAFWAINPYLIGFDTIPWNPIFIPFGLLMVFYQLHQVYRIGKIRDYFILGLIIGFFNNMHIQFFFIFLFSLIFLIIKNIFQKKLLLKKTIFVFLGYLFTFIPLLIFDLRHNFLNIKTFYNLFFSKNSFISKDRNIWWQVFNYFLDPIIPQKNNFYLTKIIYFIFLLLIIYLVKKTKNFEKKLFASLLFLWLIFPLFFFLYGQRPSEYYFVFLYPFIYLTVIKFLLLFDKKRILLIIVFFIMIWLQKNEIKRRLTINFLGLYYKDKTIKKLKELTEGKKFNISFNTPLGLNHGFSYLIDWYQIKQSGDWNDPLIEIRIPPKNQDVKINDDIGLKIPRDLR